MARWTDRFGSNVESLRQYVIAIGKTISFWIFVVMLGVLSFWETVGRPIFFAEDIRTGTSAGEFKMTTGLFIAILVATVMWGGYRAYHRLRIAPVPSSAPPSVHMTEGDFEMTVPTNTPPALIRAMLGDSTRRATARSMNTATRTRAQSDESTEGQGTLEADSTEVGRP